MTSRSRKYLTEREITEFLNAEESDVEFSDSEDDTPTLTNKPLENVVNDIIFINPTRSADIFDAVMVESQENNEIDEQIPISVVVPELNRGIEVEMEFVDEFAKYSVTEKKNIEFRRRKYTPEKHNFVPPLQEECFDEIPIKTPSDYFFKYLPLPIFERMATYTNLYAEQTGVTSRKFKYTTSEEIMQFIGIHMIMGTMKLPQKNMYWSKNLQIESVASIMSCERFYQLRSNLHMVNNLEIPDDCKDKFFKTRPLIKSILKRCHEMPVEEVISIDEQIIPFTGHLSIKQYIKGKPCPWGVKVYLLCGKSGYPYDFVLYQGSQTEISTFDAARFGHGAATVLHLIKRISSPGHQLYFDNFFSTYQLFEILNQLKINAAGTIRINRFNNPQFISDLELKKKGRGTSDQLVSRDEKIAIVKWQDNKAVYLSSNFVGKENEEIVRRFDKKSKTYVMISQPQVVNLYNKGMGGVDLLDQLISYYRIFIKSKKWTLRIIFHFIDVAVCASWIEYRKECIIRNIPQKSLLEFKQLLGRSLTAISQKCSRKRGRPSYNSQNSPEIPPTTSKYVRGEVRPLREVQYDGIDHFPHHDDCAPTRCKQTKCTGRSRIMCKKCKVHLCLTKDRNCYLDFHTK